MRKTYLIISLVLVFIFSCLFALCAFGEEITISGNVWIDSDADGIMTDNERRADERIVKLEKKGEDGNPCDIIQTVTDENGYYSFIVEGGNEYRISIETDPYYPTRHGMDSVLLPSAEKNGYSVWTKADTDLVWNCGLIKSRAVLYMVAFNDLNQNGGRSSNEDIIRRVPFTLVYEYDGTEYEIATVRTNASSTDFANFNGLTPGTYRCRVELPENYIVSTLGQKISYWYNCFQPCDANTVYSLAFDVPYDDSTGIAIGLVESGSIEGRIWYDNNSTGLKDAKVEIYNSTLQLNRETLTDENGCYTFERIQGGQYTVTVTLPEGIMFVQSGSAITEQYTETGTISAVVSTGKTTQIPDIGTEKSCMLIVTVAETDIGILQDDTFVIEEQQTPMEAFYVTIYDGEGNTVRKLKGKNGRCLINSLRQGTISFSVSSEQDVLFVVQDEETDKLCAIDGKIPYTVDQELSFIQIFATESVSIPGIIYADRENNGIRDVDDEGIANVIVQAIGKNSNVTAEVITDENGNYLFSNLLPDVYVLHFIFRDAYVAAASGENNCIVTQTPEYGETLPVRLSSGMQADPQTAGFFMAASLSGRVLLNDGFDPDMTGFVSGITAVLLDENGQMVSDHSYSVSDPEGNYTINGILPGTYTVRYIAGEDALFTLYSDNENETESSSFSVMMADNIVMPDIYAVSTGSIEGTVLHGNMPANASIELRGERCNSIYIADVDNGTFSCRTIRPDHYSVLVTLDEGYAFGLGCAEPFVPTTDNTFMFELDIGIGEAIGDIVIDAVIPGTVTGQFYMDYANSRDPFSDLNMPACGLNVVLSGNGITETVMTDDNGCFVFESVLPGSYSIVPELEESTVLPEYEDNVIGINVPDNGQSMPLNAAILKYASINGCIWNMDMSLSDVSGIRVDFCNDSDMSVVAQAVTDAEGNFSFERLLPGTYQLSAVIPEGFIYARENDLVNRVSYIVSTGYEAEARPITVGIGDTLIGIDIGIGAMGRLGDTAWLDENRNGLQDIGELQVPGILIELYQYGEFVTETVTDEYGHYDFVGLYPGVYVMRVTMPDEIMTTVHNEAFPLVNSVLPESEETTVETEVIVPSGGRNLNCDLGFVCRKEGVYPDSLLELPTIDWSYNGTKVYVVD